MACSYPYSWRRRERSFCMPGRFAEFVSQTQLTLRLFSPCVMLFLPVSPVSPSDLLRLIWRLWDRSSFLVYQCRWRKATVGSSSEDRREGRRLAYNVSSLSFLSAVVLTTGRRWPFTRWIVNALKVDWDVDWVDEESQSVWYFFHSSYNPFDIYLSFHFDIN